MKLLPVFIPLLATLPLRDAGLPLRLDALQTSSYEVVVRMQGRDMGSQKFGIERTPEGFLLTEETVTPFGGQKTRVVLNAKGQVRSVVQDGTARGMATHIELRYEDTRVRGAAQMPGDSARRPIDTAVPAGVIDDNTLQALLPALPWAADATWTFAMFSGGKNKVEERTLRVAAIDTVDVPAGRFETYRAEMKTDDALTSFYVTTAAPHRLMRIALQGVPIEFVRK